MKSPRLDDSLTLILINCKIMWNKKSTIFLFFFFAAAALQMQHPGGFPFKPVV